MVSLIFCFTWRILVLFHVVGRTCDISELILRGYCVCQNVRHWSEVVSAIFYLIWTQLLWVWRCQSFSFNFLILKEVIAIHSHSWTTPRASCSLLHTFIQGSDSQLSQDLKPLQGPGEVSGAFRPTCEGETRGLTQEGVCADEMCVCWCLLDAHQEPCTFKSLQSPPSRCTDISLQQMDFSEVTEDTDIGIRQEKWKVASG